MSQKAQKESHFTCGACGQRIARGEGYLRHNGKPEHIDCPAAPPTPKPRRPRSRGVRPKKA